MTTLRDCDGNQIQIDNVSGLVRIADVPLFKAFIVGDRIYIQIKDRFKSRAKHRGYTFIEVPLDKLMSEIVDKLA